MSRQGPTRALTGPSDGHVQRTTPTRRRCTRDQAIPATLVITAAAGSARRPQPAQITSAAVTAMLARTVTTVIAVTRQVSPNPHSAEDRTVLAIPGAQARTAGTAKTRTAPRRPLGTATA